MRTQLLPLNARAQAVKRRYLQRKKDLLLRLGVMTVMVSVTGKS